MKLKEESNKPVLKKSISSRIDISIYNIMVDASKDPNHRFYDRKPAYIVNKILDDWAQTEEVLNG